MHRHFPHLLPKEIILWEKFLDAHMEDYSYFEYDVHVGTGATLSPETPEMVRKIALGLTRKRIDVVGHTINKISIFEIKPDAGLNAVGQLLAYYYLYIRDFKPTKPVGLNLITDIIDVDTERVCRAYSIKLFTIPIRWDEYQYDRAIRRYVKKEIIGKPTISG